MKTSNLLLVALILGASPAFAAPAAETTTLHARGNPYLVDFMSISAKRADLRMEVGRRGLDAAFSGWLRREHSLVYREFVEKTLK